MKKIRNIDNKSLYSKEPIDSDHLYSISEFHNIKWFLKRIFIHRKSLLDGQIHKHLSSFILKNNHLDVGLNIGCGFYTPYDYLIKKISEKTYNIDISMTVRIFRLLSGKRIKLNDTNWEKVLKKYSPNVVFCFHSFSFIQINWVKFIQYCYNNNIKFCFDWSIMHLNDAEIGTNKFCTSEKSDKLFQELLNCNFKIYALSDAEHNIEKATIKGNNRFIVNNF